MSAALKTAAKLLGKLMTKKATNSGDGKSKGKLIAIVLSVVFFVLILIPAATISLPGLLAKNALNKLTEVFSFEEKAEDTDLYRDCLNIYNDHKNAYNEKVEEIVENLKTKNPVGYIENNIPIAPDVYATLHFDELNVYYLLAYINIKYLDYQEEKDGYKFDESMARRFYDDISTFSYYYVGKDPIFLYANVTVMSLDDIAEKYFAGQYTEDDLDKVELFKASYEGLSESN